MEIGKVDLERHNALIAEKIREWPKCKQRERIRRYYENLMNKIEPLKEENINEYNCKKELYTKQYLEGEKIFLKELMEYNERYLTKITDEVKHY